MATRKPKTRASATPKRTPRQPTDIALYHARTAIEAFYTQRNDKEDMGLGDRSMCRTIAAKYGMLDSVLRAETDKLPAGLENTVGCLSLRRHTNLLLQIKDGKAQFTMTELRDAVLRSFSPSVGPTKACKMPVFGQSVKIIGKTCMAKHRKGLMQHRQEHGRGVDLRYFNSMRYERIRMCTEDRSCAWPCYVQNTEYSLLQVQMVLPLGFPPDAGIFFGIIPRFTPQSFVWERFIYTADIAVTPPVICMRASVESRNEIDRVAASGNCTGKCVGTQTRVWVPTR